MTDLFQQAQSAADHIRTQTPSSPPSASSSAPVSATSPPRSNPPPPSPTPTSPTGRISTVVGHSGKLVLGTIGGIPVAVMQGRVHAYEGYPISQVTFPTRVLGLLGCTTLIVTNAAGGIRNDIPQGSLVAISDHINLTGTNAALGPNEPRFAIGPNSGERFFDMSTAYSPAPRALAIAEAQNKASPSPKASTSPSSAPPSKPPPRSAPSAPSVPTSSACPPSTRSSSPATWASKSSAYPSSPTWPPESSASASKTAETIHHEDVMEIGRRVERQFTTLLTALIPQITQAGHP